MKIIDAHMHFSNIESFKHTASDISKVDYSLKGIIEEYKNCGITKCIGMGVTEISKGAFPDISSSSPMILDLDTNPDSMFLCPGINPEKLDEQGLRELEELMKEKQTAGIKIYAGYYHKFVYDEVYTPVYELCSKYNLPVVIHTGDTYSDKGLLKYSHPLTVDELALKFRDVNFVIAHLGDPWILDGIEVVYKNPNVYADISGLIVSDAEGTLKKRDDELFTRRFKEALHYGESYNKIIFGTDWPLAPVKEYIEFVKELIPEEYHEDVFYNNALKVFKRLR